MLSREDAEATAAVRNAAGVPGERWFARATAYGEGFEVVRLAAAGLGSPTPTGSHVESRPRPEPPDPRPPVPPYGVA